MCSGHGHGSILPMQIAVAWLALALTCPAGAGPVVWSWATVPYFVHCSNASGPLNDGMLAVMQRASFTVVEKWQCL